MIRRPLSLALRLTLLFGVATAIVFTAFGWMVIRSTEHHFVDEDSDELMVVANAVHELLKSNPVIRDGHGLDQRFADILVGHHNASLRLTSADGELVYASASPDLADFVPTDPSGVPSTSVHEWQVNEQNFRVLTHNLSLDDATREYRLTIAVPIDHHLRFLGEFRRSLSFMIAGSIALMSFMGWVAVRQGHAPLRNIVARLRSISGDRLNTRLDPDVVPGELSELAVSFNEMLERVDGAFHRLSEFNADIAHELRTPIANLMTQTQVGLSRARTDEEYREILYSNAEEYERMAQMVSDMLFLAQADNPEHRKSFADLDLAKEVIALFDYYESWAEEHGVTLALTGNATVSGGRLMLQRVLGNLLSNAVRHTPSGGTVRVALTTINADEIEILVENPGTDIPPQHIPRLFDRFYRVDPSRQKSDQGVGLGLAIVASIINAHVGKIDVVSANGRTCFRIILPKQPSVLTS